MSVKVPPPGAGPAVQETLMRAKAICSSRVDSLQPMVVDGWLARAAASRPEHIALDTPAGTRSYARPHAAAPPGGGCSYARLHAAARSGACELAAGGAGPGARVAIALPSGLHFAQALHA